MKRWKKEQEVWRDSSCFLLCCIAVPPGEDHYPWGGGRPRAGGRRGVDPAARHRQDRPQKPSTDAHQRQSNDKHMCIKFLLRNAPFFLNPAAEKSSCLGPTELSAHAVEPMSVFS